MRIDLVFFALGLALMLTLLHRSAPELWPWHFSLVAYAAVAGFVARDAKGGKGRDRER